MELYVQEGNMERKIEKKEQKAHSKRKLIVSASVTAVVLALVIGLSYAWFFNQSNIATLISIAPPAPIAIKGPHGNSLTELDLNYTADDKKDNKVTIRRVISIENDGSDHKIEIVHTTNLKGLTFQLYRAEEVTGSSAGTSGTVTDDGYIYTYDMNSSISGSYINAAETGEYKSADKTKHDQNYEKGDSVQKHAEPLYWVTSDGLPASSLTVTQDVSSDDNANATQTHRTYYVLEISWTETEKETDIFYILAKNV